MFEFDSSRKKFKFERVISSQFAVEIDNIENQRSRFDSEKYLERWWQFDGTVQKMFHFVTNSVEILRMIIEVNGFIKVEV